MSLPDEFAEEGYVACEVYNGISIVYKSACFLAHFVSNLYVYKFGYICMGLTFLIILISIFGGIKENYRCSKVFKLVYKNNPKNFCLYSSSVVNGFFDDLFEKWDDSFATCEGCIEFGFPDWIDGFWGLTDPQTLEAARQIRVFIDSFIVLFLMAGYRESIVSFLKCVFYSLRHPRKSYLFIKTGISQTAVTIMSTAAP
uniref:Uncharacterized protein n=1 Tax=Panagrolaimus davidi TaxID=227884 RepID=A0A914PRG3_9BILA